jgi:copper chaperone
VTADRTQNKVDVHSSQPREALAAAIAEEGYTVS